MKKTNIQTLDNPILRMQKLEELTTENLNIFYYPMTKAFYISNKTLEFAILIHLRSFKETKKSLFFIVNRRELVHIKVGGLKTMAQHAEILVKLVKSIK